MRNGLKQKIKPILIALILVAVWMTASEMTYQDEVADEKLYNEMVQIGAWPARD